MTVVVDASVILKWVVPEPDSDKADALLSAELIAPSFWITEVANALWRRTVRREFEIETARRLLEKLQVAPIVSVDFAGDIGTAFALAAELNHPIYDCLYLALAIREDTYVVTADRRFAALAGKRADLNGRIRALA